MIMSSAARRKFKEVMESLETQLARDYYHVKRVTRELNSAIESMRLNGTELLNGSTTTDTSIFYSIWDSFEETIGRIIEQPFVEVVVAYGRERFENGCSILKKFISRETDVDASWHDLATTIRVQMHDLKERVNGIDPPQATIKSLAPISAAIRVFWESLSHANRPIFRSHRFSAQEQKDNQRKVSIYFEDSWKCMRHTSEVIGLDSGYDPWRGDHTRAWKKVLMSAGKALSELFPAGMRLRRRTRRSETPREIEKVLDEEQGYTKRNWDKLNEKIRALEDEVERLTRELHEERAKEQKEPTSQWMPRKISDQTLLIANLKASIARLQKMMRFHVSGRSEESDGDELVGLRKENELLKIENERLVQMIKSQKYRDREILKMVNVEAVPTGELLEEGFVRLREEVKLLRMRLETIEEENVTLVKKAAKKRQYKEEVIAAIGKMAKLEEKHETEHRALADSLAALSVFEGEAIDCKGRVAELERDNEEERERTERDKREMSQRMEALSGEEKIARQAMQVTESDMEKIIAENRDLAIRIQYLMVREHDLTVVVNQKNEEIDGLMCREKVLDRMTERVVQLGQEIEQQSLVRKAAQERVADFEIQVSVIEGLRRKNTLLASHLDAMKLKYSVVYKADDEHVRWLRAKDVRIAELEAELEVSREQIHEHNNVITEMRRVLKDRRSQDLLIEQIVDARSLKTELTRTRSNVDDREDEMHDMVVKHLFCEPDSIFVN